MVEPIKVDRVRCVVCNKAAKESTPEVPFCPKCFCDLGRPKTLEEMVEYVRATPEVVRRLHDTYYQYRDVSCTLFTKLLHILTPNYLREHSEVFGKCTEVPGKFIHTRDAGLEVTEW